MGGRRPPRRYNHPLAVSSPNSLMTHRKWLVLGVETSSIFGSRIGPSKAHPGPSGSSGACCEPVKKKMPWLLNA